MWHSPGAGPGTGVRCLADGFDLQSSGYWSSGNPAFAISRGSRDAPSLTPEPGRRFSGMLCSPSPFPGWVSHQTQEPPSEFLPAEPGIQQGASWRTATGPRRGPRPGRRAVRPRRMRSSGHGRSPRLRGGRRARRTPWPWCGRAADQPDDACRCPPGSCRSCVLCAGRTHPPPAPAACVLRAPAGGVSAAAVSTGSPGPRVCLPGGRRPGPPTSRPPAAAPSATRRFASHAGRSGHQPALRTWPACRRGHGSGTAGPVTRSPQDARRPRCRRDGVRIGCAPGLTSSRRHDTRLAPPMHGPARVPTRHRLPPFRSQLHRPGGTTGPGGTHHPRSFMIAVVVTLRGSGTESDPEPHFKRRRHRFSGIAFPPTRVPQGNR
ncbi:hypothetical protein BN159_0084 [Streptomyces davaonensis JCM 4913]|uniref:Uncharacterized protein n=1 Tax=Streptomyces davaonensis (strain DSM 101723 / JCM 4913 / KCC S-0913 / 768) TaxID=1214101 RepID=K4QU70_STRDJ|nr:hypothetical protein BN159_0084 [Streptomyces davaonensis JCM 4913]